MAKPRRHFRPRAAIAAAAVLVALSAATPVPADDAPRPGARTLLLVRHGHYEAQEGVDPEVGLGLSERGREQARLTGQWLAATGIPFHGYYASSMTRARETAALAAGALPGVTPVIDRDVRECGPPSGQRQYGDTPGEMADCRVRLERAWARYARPTAGGDSTDVIVCHGNVIRYFTMRAAGQPVGDWATLGTTHCSVTEIVVRPDGTTRLISYNGTGHLPARLVGWPPRNR